MDVELRPILNLDWKYRNGFGASMVWNRSLGHFPNRFGSTEWNFALEWYGTGRRETCVFFSFFVFSAWRRNFHGVYAM